MNLETSSDLSLHNFLGFKRVFQADEFTVWFFWKHGNSFSSVLAYLVGRGHHLLTSLAVVWIRLQLHQASFKWAITCHLSCDRAVSLLKRCTYRDFPYRDGGLHFQTHCQGSIALYLHYLQKFIQTIFILIFPQKTISSISGLLLIFRKAQQCITLKCIPVTRVSKGNICTFTSSG